MFESFKVFDKSKTGMLECGDLRHVLEKMGETVTEDEIKALMREIDVDGDDRISFHEFQGFLQQKSK